jgi:hypothetical protein
MALIKHLYVDVSVRIAVLRTGSLNQVRYWHEAEVRSSSPFVRWTAQNGINPRHLDRIRKLRTRDCRFASLQ